MSITGEAIEVAALAIYGGEDDASLWVDEDPQVNGYYLSAARLALEAAAPHMLARAWVEGRDSLALDLCNPLDTQGFRPATPNPYEVRE